MKRILWIVLALCLSVCAVCGRAEAPADTQRLVLYTAHKPEVYEPIVREFEGRTGLWVEIVSGGSGEMLERIAAERADPQADLMFGGGVESLEAYNVCFTDCPIDVSFADDCRLPDSRWLPFSSLPMVLIYNPKLTEAPAGWADLLDPRLKGRIAFADPTVSGSSYTALFALMQALPMPDTLERFHANLDGLVLEGSGDVVGAVANGRCLVGVTLEETALKGIAAGQDIAMVYPSEGTSAVPDGVALVAGCRHRENALAFVRFILGIDVQSRLSTRFYRRSVLAGEDGALPFPLLDYDIAAASAQKADLLRRWNGLEGDE